MDEAVEAEDAAAVDEPLEPLLWRGRLLLLKPRLLERCLFPWPLPRLTKLMSESSLSSNAVVKAGDAAVEAFGAVERLLLKLLLMLLTE